jgi:flavin reductase ActVB
MAKYEATVENCEKALFCDLFRRAGSHIPSGAAVLAGTDPQEGPFGFLVSTLTAVSMNPALISVCVERDARGLARLRGAGRFSVNLLGEEHADLAMRFAKHGSEHFKRLDWGLDENDVPILQKVVAIFVCELEKEIEAGDHEILIGKVKRVVLPGGRPLIYWRRAFQRLRLDYPFLESDATLGRFVADWETGVLPPARWTHGAHVAATAYYAFDHTPEGVFERMKKGILHFAGCVGIQNTETSGYHESLTRFWASRVAEFVRAGQFSSRLEAARSAVDAFGEDRDHYRLYYSFDLAHDRRARREWVAPDRVPPLAGG